MIVDGEESISRKSTSAVLNRYPDMSSSSSSSSSIAEEGERGTCAAAAAAEKVGPIQLDCLSGPAASFIGWLDCSIGSMG